MKFEELQRAWDSVKSEPKSDDELFNMMYTSPAWRLRNLTEEEVIDLSLGGLFAFIVVVDGFVNYIALSALMGIIQVLYHYLGLRYLRFLPQKDTFQKTLTNALTCIKRLALISWIINILNWIALVLILGTKVHVGEMNMILWALMLLPVLVAVIWWSSRTWSKKRDEVNDLIKEFDEEAGVNGIFRSDFK